MLAPHASQSARRPGDPGEAPARSAHQPRRASEMGQHRGEHSGVCSRRAVLARRAAAGRRARRDDRAPDRLQRRPQQSADWNRHAAAAPSGAPSSAIDVVPPSSAARRLRTVRAVAGGAGGQPRRRHRRSVHSRSIASSRGRCRAASTNVATAPAEPGRPLPATPLEAAVTHQAGLAAAGRRRPAARPIRPAIRPGKRPVTPVRRSASASLRAGLATGAGSRKAGTAVAGFFSRAGKAVAGGF